MLSVVFLLSLDGLFDASNSGGSGSGTGTKFFELSSIPKRSNILLSNNFNAVLIICLPCAILSNCLINISFLSRFILSFILAI